MVSLPIDIRVVAVDEEKGYRVKVTSLETQYNDSTKEADKEQLKPSSRPKANPKASSSKRTSASSSRNRETFPYFRQCKHLSKDSLSVLLNSASEEIRQSKTGHALRKYIDNQQIPEGMPFQTFPCYDVEGNPFDWNLIKGSAFSNCTRN